MKKILKLIPIFCTLLLLGLGACMPHLISSAFDRQLKQEIIQREDNLVSLTILQNLDFFQTLELFHNWQSQIILTEGYQMTEKEVALKAESIMLFFDITNIEYSNPEVTPVLFTNYNTPSWSGVFWKCIWNNSFGEQEVLWLDDKTGLMLAFEKRLKKPAKIVTVIDEGHEYIVTREEYLYLFQVQMEKITNFCKFYYPVDNMILELTNINDNFSNYTLTLGKEEKDDPDTGELSYVISINLIGEWIYFNL